MFNAQYVVRSFFDTDPSAGSKYLALAQAVADRPSNPCSGGGPPHTQEENLRISWRACHSCSSGGTYASTTVGETTKLRVRHRDACMHPLLSPPLGACIPTQPPPETTTLADKESDHCRRQLRRPERAAGGPRPTDSSIFARCSP